MNSDIKQDKEQIMSNKRESKLWKEIGWLRFLLAIAATFILGGIYFMIWQWSTSVWRDLFLSITSGLIPVPLVFILAYIVFRRIEELRSERDVDELADKVMLKFAQALAEARVGNSNVANPVPQVSKLKLKIYDEFDITDRKFESTSGPQKLIFRFTNRGSNIIHLNKIEYSEKGRGLPKSALLKTYRVGSKGVLIPIDQGNAEVLPGGEYMVELSLAQTYSIEAMNSLAGKSGYLTFEITYAGEVVDNLLYPV